MPRSGFGFAGATTQYIKADAINSFEIRTAVPAGLVPPVSADVVSPDVASPDAQPEKVALLPLQIRLRIPRREKLLVGRWDELDRSDDPLGVFMEYGTVWVRSVHTTGRDLNLLSSLSGAGLDPKRCVRAFVHDDMLYLDFIVFLADAKSRKAGMSAFLEGFTDDKVPYILLGDGKKDGLWNLSFFVSETGPNPNPNPKPTEPTEPTEPTPMLPVAEGKGGGGGCDGGWGALALLFAGFLVARSLRGRD